MTAFPEDLFTQIYRRALTAEDRTRLLAIKAGLGLSPRDEMWPVILVLDHYDTSIRAGRSATVKEINSLVDNLKSISEKAGPIADAEARKAIANLIEEASDKIAKASATKSMTTADRISKQKLIVSAITGATIATLLASAGAATMYLLLDARGICAEAPVETRSGALACIVERASG